jgi:hypoxanthine phosphoribosyltransferase
MKGYKHATSLGSEDVTPEDLGTDLSHVLFTEDEILTRIAQVAAEVERDYAGKDFLLIGVLKGAMMLMADFSREVSRAVEIDWMAISSYGSGTKSSGVVRILKDLDVDIAGRHVLIVEDVLDSGLTLSWLMGNLERRGAASVEVFTLLRKPEAAKIVIEPKYVGFDIPSEFVVGYGLDYDQRYRNLRCVGTLAPHVYGG